MPKDDVLVLTEAKLAGAIRLLRRYYELVAVGEFSSSNLAKETRAFLEAHDVW